MWFKKFYIWLTLIAAAGLIILAGVLLHYLNKPIQKIVVVGYFDHLQPACIKPILEAQHFKRFDHYSDTLLLQAQAACPWLKSWHWQFAFKPILLIYLAENKPTFIWNNKSYINQEHHVFAVKPNSGALDNHSLVALSGDPSQLPDILNLYDQANPLLAEQNFNIVSLTDTPNNGFVMTLNNGIALKLSQDQALDQLKRFLKVDGSLFNKPHKKIKAIDLRYPHGFAVQWKA